MFPIFTLPILSPSKLVGRVSPCTVLCFWLGLKHYLHPIWLQVCQWHKMEGESLLNHCFPQFLQRISCSVVWSTSSLPSCLPWPLQDCFSHVLLKMLSSAALAFITTAMYGQFNLLPNFILLYHFIQRRSWYCLSRSRRKGSNSP